jgi:Flp pilus assembly pilin Flp
MTGWNRLAVCLRRDDRGASMVEYALLLCLIAIVCSVALSFIGHASSQPLSDAGAGLATTTTTTAVTPVPLPPPETTTIPVATTVPGGHDGGSDGPGGG